LNALKKLSIQTLSFWFFVLMLFVSMIDGGTYVNRALRLVPNVMALLIIVFLFTSKTHKFPTLFLIFLLLAAVSAFLFERPFFSYATILLGTVAYVFAAFTTIAKLGRIQANWPYGFYFLCVF